MMRWDLSGPEQIHTGSSRGWGTYENVNVVEVIPVVAYVIERTWMAHTPLYTSIITRKNTPAPSRCIPPTTQTSPHQVFAKPYRPQCKCDWWWNNMSWNGMHDSTEPRPTEPDCPAEETTSSSCYSNPTATFLEGNNLHLCLSMRLTAHTCNHQSANLHSKRAQSPNGLRLRQFD